MTFLFKIKSTKFINYVKNFSLEGNADRQRVFYVLILNSQKTPNPNPSLDGRELDFFSNQSVEATCVSLAFPSSPINLL